MKNYNDYLAELELEDVSPLIETDSFESFKSRSKEDEASAFVAIKDFSLLLQEYQNKIGRMFLTHFYWHKEPHLKLFRMKKIFSNGMESISRS
ncbi:hypothetical protein [Chryseobacterium sp. 52]|uniref:hypothetical protein n=1 Tax=Chryseobacterium sp. 52 TaxID=2035213 RepID=UPI001181093B|nr:hypothetical protein [Chryseobacterium sp. 52]